MVSTSVPPSPRSQEVSLSMQPKSLTILEMKPSTDSSSFAFEVINTKQKEHAYDKENAGATDPCDGIRFKPRASDKSPRPPPLSPCNRLVNNKAASTTTLIDHKRSSPMAKSEKQSMLKQIAILKQKLKEEEKKAGSVPRLESMLKNTEQEMTKIRHEFAIARGEHAAIVESYEDELRKTNGEGTSIQTGRDEKGRKGEVECNDYQTRKSEETEEDGDNDGEDEGSECSDITDSRDEAVQVIKADQLQQFVLMTADLTEKLQTYQKKVENLQTEKDELLIKLEHTCKEKDDLVKDNQQEKSRNDILKHVLDEYQKKVRQLNTTQIHVEDTGGEKRKKNEGVEHRASIPKGECSSPKAKVLQTKLRKIISCVGILVEQTNKTNDTIKCLHTQARGKKGSKMKLTRITDVHKENLATLYSLGKDAALLEQKCCIHTSCETLTSEHKHLPSEPTFNGETASQVDKIALSLMELQLKCSRVICSCQTIFFDALSGQSRSDDECKRQAILLHKSKQIIARALDEKYFQAQHSRENKALTSVSEDAALKTQSDLTDRSKSRTFQKIEALEKMLSEQLAEENDVMGTLRKKMDDEFKQHVSWVEAMKQMSKVGLSSSQTVPQLDPEKSTSRSTEHGGLEEEASEIVAMIEQELGCDTLAVAHETDGNNSVPGKIGGTTSDAETIDGNNIKGLDLDIRSITYLKATTTEVPCGGSGTGSLTLQLSASEESGTISLDVTCNTPDEEAHRH